MYRTTEQMHKEQQEATKVTATHADKVAAIFVACIPLAHAEMLRRWDKLRDGESRPPTLPFIGTKEFDSMVADRAGEMANRIIAHVWNKK